MRLIIPIIIAFVALILINSNFHPFAIALALIVTLLIAYQAAQRQNKEE